MIRKAVRKQQTLNIIMLQKINKYLFSHSRRLKFEKKHLVRPLTVSDISSLVARFCSPSLFTLPANSFEMIFDYGFSSAHQKNLIVNRVTPTMFDIKKSICYF